MFRSERGLCPRHRILGGGSEGGATPPSECPRKGDDMRVGLAADHGGFHLKEDMAGRLRKAGHEVTDFGASTYKSDDDYPDFITPLGRALVAGQIERGLAICG